MLRLERIVQYEAVNGKVPFREWLISLDAETRARIRARLDRLLLGNLGDCKSVGNGVRELRLHFGAGCRIYFGIKNRTIVVLLIGGDKKNQQKDIKLAKQYWDDYQNSNEKN